ncbi:MAG: aminoglycoside phosphotransferase family protein [Ilumatobacteraceae bacterium]
MLDHDAAYRTACSAAARWGLEPPELLRHGMNAIYTCGDVVLRVGRASAPAIASHELVTVLIGNGVPTVPPVSGLAIDLDGFAVTAWERVEPVDQAVDWEAVGAAIAITHRLERADLPTSYPTPSPVVFPWWDFDAMFTSVDRQIDTASSAGLARAISDGQGWQAAVPVAAVVCHGDVHPGNVMMSSRGPLLIDWDLMCVANPAWDHAMLTTYADRWGGAPGVYDAFAAGYGASFVDDDLTRTLARLRNVAATLMRVKAGLVDPLAKVEAERRLRYWAGDSAAPSWRAQ